jgi:hypothetical protein
MLVIFKLRSQSQMKLSAGGLLLLCAVTAVITTGCSSGPKAVTFTTTYQAVLLNNNSVYYGKLEGFGTANPVLTSVFYIVTKSDPETKQVQNVLVKRGKELHGPDRMYLNPNSIVFVEPVGPESRVAQLISEANKQP